MGCFPSRLQSESTEENVVPQRVPTAPDSTVAASNLEGRKKELSLEHVSLPTDAVPYTVRNVYDGDTLTLVSGQRVRFLGVDCPELKEKHPFAMEAKEFTKQLCNSKQIWISFSSNQQETDHYDRLLSLVWVRSEDKDSVEKYICVNEALVSQGFASVYTVQKLKSSDHFFHRLVALQKRARQDCLGIWKDFRDYKVSVTPNGTAYHLHSSVSTQVCTHLKNSKSVRETTAAVAMDEGLHPCRTCITGLVPQ